jgi:hypothetical protein
MKIFNIFKKKPAEPVYNIHHPDLADKIEFAFECGPLLNKRKFYRLKADANSTNEFRLPTGRYQWLDAFLHEAEIRMTVKTGHTYLDELIKHLDGSKGTINLAKAFEVIYSMRSRLNLGFEPQMIKRLASVVYFDANEDLSQYDQLYGEEKIKYWERHECYDFFLTRPIAELCNLNGTSITALKNYIREAEQVIRDLTYEPEKVSLGNTLKNKN